MSSNTSYTGQMIKNEKFCDVFFTFPNSSENSVDGPTGSNSGPRVPAHKNLLATASPVFEELFFGDESSSSRFIEISDFSIEAIKNMIDFIYNDKLDQELPMLMETLSVAKRYRIVKLETMCRELLLDEIKEPIETIAQIQTWAQRNDEPKILTKCVRLLHALQLHPRTETDSRPFGIWWTPGSLPSPRSSISHGTLNISSEAENYDMNLPCKGKVVVFNHQVFKPELKVDERIGTAEDKNRLVQTFKSLGFLDSDINVFPDLKKEHIDNVLEKLQKYDYDDCACLIICMLSHGDHGTVCAKDKRFPTKDLWERFLGDKCPSLAGKPKIFIIQACQGGKLDQGVGVQHDRTDRSKDRFMSRSKIYTIPSHADFLIAYSTVPGFFSWCNTGTGSWFIQSLCSVLMEHGGDLDLLSCMSKVIRRVSYRYKSNHADVEKCDMKQVPYITSMLTRRFYFNSPTIRNEAQAATPVAVEDRPDSSRRFDERSMDIRSFSSNNLPANLGRINLNADSDDYLMRLPRKGKVVIFNNKKFASRLNLSERIGTEKDGIMLENSFRRLGFTDVKVHNDTTKARMDEILLDMRGEDYTDCACLIICFLSHGGHNGAVFASDAEFQNRELWDHFLGDKCPSLAGKPKIFFVQACQGDKLDKGVDVVHLDRTDRDMEEESQTDVHWIPSHADFLVVYSTVPGYYAWRNTVNGSWFVQSLCSVLDEHDESTDLISQLTKVARRVAYRFTSNTPNLPNMDQMKQVPCLATMLTRRVFL